jgi:hypothetical protein
MRLTLGEKVLSERQMVRIIAGYAATVAPRKRFIVL